MCGALGAGTSEGVDLLREKDTERLRSAALLLEAENRRLITKVVELTRKLAVATGADASELQQRIAELEGQLAKRNRMLFAPSTEQRPATKVDKPPRAKREGHGPKLQPRLPVVEKLHELDEADQACTSCGGKLAAWEGQFEDSEEVDVLVRKFVLVKHRRQKYRCNCGGCVETALPSEKLFAGARYSIDFAIEVAVQKYLDHLPLERQVRIMDREGLDADSQTLWDYLERLARLLREAYERLGKHVLSFGIVGADETRWPLLGAPPAERSKWHAWALATARAVFYRILDGRSAESARQVLRDYEGVVVADGYAVYTSLAKQSGGFVVANCWSHARRALLEAEPNFPEATRGLELIGELYAIEKLCPTGPPGDEQRRRLRNERSRAVVARIQEWALSQRALPQSGLGKAIAYLGTLWNGLVRFLEDPRIPIDNNATERAMRGPVIGRKNHYGSRSRRGTEVAALFYSFFESAKLCGLEPKAYLRAAVTAALRGETVPLPHEMVEPA